MIDTEHTTRISLSNLKTSVPVRWYQTLGPWYLENRFTFPIRKALVRNKLAFKIITLVHKYLTSRLIALEQFLKGYDNSVRRLSSSSLGNEIDSEFGYAGDVFIHELLVADKYKKQIDEGFVGPSESKQLYEHVDEVMSSLLEATGAPCCLNFGVCYAYTDAVLARKYPKIEFFGIERTDAAKIYNQRFFADIGNLTMFSGDIFELLSKQRFNGGIFFHSRTLLLLPQHFVRKLYAAAREAGFKYIFGTEQYGVSRQTGNSYEFSYDPQESVVYRDFMYIHNYPNILSDCGFELMNIESLVTDHPHADFRILSFQARAVQ